MSDEIYARDLLGDRLGGATLTCDVNGCEDPALVCVLPTHGETSDAALRCRDCFTYDTSRDWFRRWRDSVLDRGDGGDGA